MSRRFESENINHSDGTELMSEEKARKKIVEHLNKADSLQIQVFADFTFRQFITALILEPSLTESEKREQLQSFVADMKTMNRRSEEFKKYKEEFGNIAKITDPYFKVCNNLYPIPHERYLQFARGLDEISQAIARKSQQSQTTPEK